LGRYAGENGAEVVRQTVADLRNSLATEGIRLEVLPGADVRVQEDLPELIGEKGTVLTVADRRRWILLEMPGEFFFDIGPLIAKLKGMGIGSILTHPERYGWNDLEIGRALQWRRKQGMLMQVTAGSLLGNFGPVAQRWGWQWLENGLVDVIASDAHNCDKRPPLLRDAFDAITKRLGESVAKRVMISTPRKILEAGMVTGS